MSQPGASAGPPNTFHTNVNRAKTKKWVEAKSYSYDGDDWGEVDDYDEYGGYDEPEAAPRPTGLRQRGQSASQPHQETQAPRRDLYESPVDIRPPHGNVSGPPLQQHYSNRSATNPQPQPHGLPKMNSFDQGDERRSFSQGRPRQPMGGSFSGPYINQQPQGRNIAAHDFQPGPTTPNQPGQPQSPARPPIHAPQRSSMEGQRRHGDIPQSFGGNTRGFQPDQARQPTSGGRSQSMTSNTPPFDPQNRRDFSPSAMPPPLQTRGSPSPHENPDSRSSSRHPPRKSSLGQDSAPTIPFPTQPSTGPASGEEMSSARERSASGASKQLPFVRPADIYRRMQEEKEKERLSQESSRPSMDSILGKPTERPGTGKPQESDSSQRLKPMLDPVAERKSEYGMEGITPNERARAQSKPPTSSAKRFEFQNRPPDSSHGLKSSLGSMLPDVSRVSGFGESFGQSFFGSGEDKDGSTDLIMHEAGPSTASKAQDTTPSPSDRDLRNQPSLGFTSAVHQSFDSAQDQVPPTPSSAAGSTVGRSTSAGTSTVSPIISRGPSTATDNFQPRLPAIDDVSTRPIAEGMERKDVRPISSESRGTPSQTARKPSPSNLSAKSKSTPPPGFIPGHRRDMSTPSPDNSPARIPAVKSNIQTDDAKIGELATATPIEARPSTLDTFQPDQNGAVMGRGPDQMQSFSSQPFTLNTHTQENALFGKNDQKASPVSPRDREESPGSGTRVRNLADKFEGDSRPGSAHSTTPRAGALRPGIQHGDDLAPPRPLADRNDSFRPHLPGGWESSASLAPAAGLRTTETGAGHQQPDSASAADKITDGSSKSLREPIDSMADPQQSSVSPVKDASEEAFAAVAAAGNALAGAFAGAVGIEYGTAADSDEVQQSSSEAREHGSGNHVRDASMDTVVHPEAVKPSDPATADDDLPSTAPTPVPDTMRQKATDNPADVDYFPSENIEKAHTSRANQVEPPNRVKEQPTLPLLSTGAKPQYESDRLRKEIVRELTPMSATEPTTAETDESNYSMSLQPTTSSAPHPGHESGVLPREYESYWNDASSDDDTSQFSGEPGHVENATTAHRQHGASVIAEPLHINTQPQNVPSAPVPAKPCSPVLISSPAISSTPIVESQPSEARPNQLAHRFSWEQPLQELSPTLAPVEEQSAAHPSDILQSAIYPAGKSFQPHESFSDTQEHPPTPRDIPGPADDPPRLPEKVFPENVDQGIVSHQRAISVDKELPAYPQGLEETPELPEKGFDEPGFGKSVVIEQNSPLSHIESGDRHEEPIPEPSRQHTLDMGHQAPVSPSQAPVNPQSKIPAFREILALKTPTERIRGYDDARSQFASMDTGLARWLAATVDSLPEHRDLLDATGRPAQAFRGHKPSPSKSKLGGLLSTPDGATTAGPIMVTSSQGLSPSGGSGAKISSQQVQAKGKDLLHSAGKYGGKANVAAKGLFSKGKSKFRAASGAEKASSSPFGSPAFSRGMQTPKFEPATPQRIDQTRLGSGDATSKPPSALRSPVHRSPPKSPCDTPSLESFTQSNEGDDERSEDSAPIQQAPPPRKSSLGHPPRNQDENFRQPVTIGDNAPIFLKETPTADSYVISSKETSAPRSANSSNKTPTQSNFVGAINSSPTHSPRDAAETQIEVNEARGAPEPPSSPQSRYFVQVPQVIENRNVSSTGWYDMTSEDAQPIPEESKNAFETVRSDEGLDENMPGSTQPSQPQNEQNGFMARAPERLKALRQSQAPRPSPLQLPIQNGQLTPRERPVSSIHTPERTLRPSQDYSLRAPSIDGFPSPVSALHSPPPLSPPRPTMRNSFEERGRAGPIHYGIDHDFVPDGIGERSRSRSPSYTGRSVGSQLSQEFRPPNEPPLPPLQDHPAYRQNDEIDVGSGHRSSSKPRSRRGSRTSALFKALGRSPEADRPPLPNASDSEANSTQINSPTTEEKKRKSTSILRSLTGNRSGSGSGSLQSKENLAPMPQYQYPRHSRTEPAQWADDDEFPMRTPSSNKWSRKLQRASTSGDAKSGEKKKRFSAIGSLFGRNQKRQSSFGSSQLPSQKPALSNQQQPDPYGASPASMPSHEPLIFRKESTEPPAGGYYAPGRTDAKHGQPGSNLPKGLRKSHTSSGARDAPAYAEDSALRQKIAERMSLSNRPKAARESAHLSQSSRRPSSSSQAPQSPPTHQVVDRRTSRDTQFPPNSWTRFSNQVRERSRSKSRNRQSTPPQPSLAPLTSPHPTTHDTPLPSNSSAHFRRSFHEPDRMDSPPPPPPPPKDDWHRPRPRDSTALSPERRPGHGISPSQSSVNTVQHIPSPSQPLPSSRPSSQTRQSLPPLQTNIATKSKRSSATAAAGAPPRQVTPEEKRASRRMEIERGGTVSPLGNDGVRVLAGESAAARTGANERRGRVGDEEGEGRIVMSATSFPGQEWTPGYHEWGGE